MLRMDQKLEDTWNLSYIYEDQNLLRKDIESCNKITKDLVENKDALFKTSDSTYETIRCLEELDTKLEHAYVYSHHLLDEDILNSNSQELVAYVENNLTKMMEQLSFMNPLILENKDEISKYLGEERFEEYRKYFSDIFRFRDYTLSPREENIISMTSEMSSTAFKVYSSLVDSEFKFGSVKVGGEDVTLTSGNFYNFLTNPVREVRREAFEKLYTPYEEHNNTLSLLLLGQVKQASFYTKVRGYKNNMQRALYTNHIDTDVYQNLITVIGNNVDINHRYLQQRKKILGLKKLHFYDVYVPLIAEIDREIEYKEAEEITIKALGILGDRYTKKIEKAFANRWIDIYENENKRSGAYSGGTYAKPAYILLNYNNSLNDLFTLVHELGHSMHTVYANEKNNIFNAGYKIFVAEVASTVNELLLIHHLLEEASDSSERLYLLNYLLEQFRTTVMRQSMFAEFEMKLHSEVESDKEVTKETLNNLYLDLNKKYYGTGIDYDEQIKYEWSRIPHFYYNFYVYQYATSFCAAVEISNRILDKKENMVEKYLEFLALGDSVPPLKALKTLGIDLTKTDVLEHAMQSYRNIAEEFYEEWEAGNHDN